MSFYAWAQDASLLDLEMLGQFLGEPAEVSFSAQESEVVPIDNTLEIARRMVESASRRLSFQEPELL